MFFSPGLEQLDPALIAFVKCHVTSPSKWEVLRTLANQDGAWTRTDELARATHRPIAEVAAALVDLERDGVVELQPSLVPADVRCRLPVDEPTSIVLHRLIQAATHSQEVREIIAAHLQHVRFQSHALEASSALA